MNQDIEQRFQAHKIVKRFHHIKVIDELSFELEQGDVALLLGANGCGKSTLLRMCSGLLRPDSGVFEYSGKVQSAPFRKLAYSTHDLMLYKRLSALENLKLFSSLAGTESTLASCLSEWKLEDFAARPLHTLSQGQKRRVSLARTFMGDPKYIFLDEPSTALDEDSLALLGERISSHQSAGCIQLIATHDIDRLLPVANKILVLSAGRIVHRSTDSFEESLQCYRQVNR